MGYGKAGGTGIMPTRAAVRTPVERKTAATDGTACSATGLGSERALASDVRWR